ncbi:MAG: pyridoxal phosphate-dependent aminotransferase [Bacteroidetes bacterium]|nr:pyridoxal phosphate-dependent aminotransferase [Bacteroidota bacterium]
MLSDRINKISESETLAMAQKCRELQAEGHDVINLSLGEPDFFTPFYIKDAAKEGIDKNFTFYSPVAGYLDLRKAICDKFLRDNNLAFKPDQIVVSNGAKQSIANVVLCLLNPGDEVIIPSPYWVTYKEVIKLAEAKPVYIHATIENEFKIGPEQLKQAITPKSKLFIFSSPCNPTGTVYSKDELRELAEVFAGYPQVYILSDEIYEHINFVGKHETIAQFEAIRDRVIIANGVSKGYAMTGWRIGYIGANRTIAHACEKLQSQFTSGPSGISQRAALKAIAEGGQHEEMRSMLAAFRERRDLLIDMLQKVPGIKVNHPEGAFYLFTNITYYFGKTDGNITINTCDDLAMYLLNKAFVALIPGSAFGNPNCIRFSYATSKENLTEAVKRIEKALGKLK